METAAGFPLQIERLIAAPVDRVWQAWTDPALLPLWYCPAPWGVARAELDVRPGGSQLIVMRSPEGEEFPNRGVYLAVEPCQRLVFTDAFVEAWVPSQKPFMVGEILLSVEQGKTRYVARSLHWCEEDRQQHEQMGFHDGWNTAADQLQALLAGS